MSKGNVLAGILLGAAAGAVLGILMAPDKGSKTRKKITDKTGTLSNDLKNRYNDLSDSLKEKYDSIRSEANEILQKSKAAKEDIKRDFV